MSPRREGSMNGVKVRNGLLTAMLVAALGLAAGASARAAAQSQPTQVRAAFFANWDRYARGYFVNQIPAARLNVIDYAFAMPTAAGTCALSDSWSDYQAPTWSGDNSVDGVADDPSDPNQHLFGNFNQLVKLKAAHPSLRVVMSIGGWTLSKYFSDVAATAASRQAFVQSCIDLLLAGNLPTGGWPEQSGGAGAAAGLFDGIDIDWEYPGIDPGNGADHSPVDNDLANGVAPDKLVVGVPFYGKRYVGVPSANNGLYQSFVPQSWPYNDSPTFHELVDSGLTDGNLTVIGPTALAPPKNLGSEDKATNG